MGTSSIFNGKNDKNPLIPEDYEEEGKPQENKVTWQTVKTDMSKYINSGGSHGSAKHIAKQYVKASGGAHRLAASSKSGVRAGNNIAGFFGSIQSNGVIDTFRNLGIQLEGKTAQEIFSHLADKLAPESNTKEDMVARRAIQSALTGIYDYVESNDLDISSIEKMPEELMNTALCEYTGAYIWTLMMNDLESRLEKYISEAQDAQKMEQEFKDMIMDIVKVEFSKQSIVLTTDIGDAMGELYEKCLVVMEEMV